METSVFIAKLFAVAYVVVGLGVLFNPGHYKKVFDDMMKSSSFIYLGGVMALIAGFLILNVHNVWVKDWTVVITVFGWLALVKGVLLLVVPQPLLKFSQVLLKKLWIVGIGALAMGVVFGYFGFYGS